MATSRRTTRSRNSRGGSNKKSDDGSGGKGRGSLSTKPAKKWINVKRPPAKGVGFEVDMWIPVSKLTAEERERYLPKEEEKQYGDLSAISQPDSATSAPNQTHLAERPVSASAPAISTTATSSIAGDTEIPISQQHAVEPSAYHATLTQQNEKYTIAKGEAGSIGVHEHTTLPLSAAAVDNPSNDDPDATLAALEQQQQQQETTATLDNQANATSSPIMVSHMSSHPETSANGGLLLPTNPCDGFLLQSANVESKRSAMMTERIDSAQPALPQQPTTGTTASTDSSSHPNQHTISSVSVPHGEEPVPMEE